MYFEFFSSVTDRHFIAKKVYAGYPFSSDDDGIYEVTHCYSGCDGTRIFGSEQLYVRFIGDMGDLTSLEPRDPKHYIAEEAYWSGPISMYCIIKYRQYIPH